MQTCSLKTVAKFKAHNKSVITDLPYDFYGVVSEGLNYVSD
jgi:hypothetical protein